MLILAAVAAAAADGKPHLSNATSEADIQIDDFSKLCFLLLLLLRYTSRIGNTMAMRRAKLLLVLVLVLVGLMLLLLLLLLVLGG